jgi:hypothetical protein
MIVSGAIRAYSFNGKTSLSKSAVLRSSRSGPANNKQPPYGGCLLFLCFGELDSLAKLLRILLELDFPLDTLLILAGVASLSGLLVFEHYEAILGHVFI